MPFEAYGVECGEGWAGLYRPLIDLCNLYGIQVLQVKEKFGGLRFYVGGTDDPAKDISLLITAAEAQSYHTCEHCGEQGYGYDTEKRESFKKVTTEASESSYWIRSLCGPCRTKHDERRHAETVEAARLREEADKDVH